MWCRSAAGARRLARTAFDLALPTLAANGFAPVRVFINLRRVTIVAP